MPAHLLHLAKLKILQYSAVVVFSEFLIHGLVSICYGKKCSPQTNVEAVKEPAIEAAGFEPLGHFGWQSSTQATGLSSKTKSWPLLLLQYCVAHTNCSFLLTPAYSPNIQYTHPQYTSGYQQRHLLPQGHTQSVYACILCIPCILQYSIVFYVFCNVPCILQYS